jgi:hypothetical protein
MFLFFVGYFMALSVSGLCGRMNDELKRVWKEVVVA